MKVYYPLKIFVDEHDLHIVFMINSSFLLILYKPSHTTGTKSRFHIRNFSLQHHITDARKWSQTSEDNMYSTENVSTPEYINLKSVEGNSSTLKLQS